MTKQCCLASDGAARQAAENSFSGFFTHLFDTSSYPPRWQCGAWSTLEGSLHIIADVGIFASYFAIPVILIYTLRKQKNLPFRPLLILFSAFIVLCGTGHLLEAVIFYLPLYRLAGLLKLATAVVSTITAIAMIRILPEALKLPGLMTRNEELRRADLAKSEFLANMSHEIRTPMTAILGYAELLLESKSETERTEYAQTIKRNGQHLLAVLNDILDLSKIEAGKLEVERIPCDIGSLVKDSVELQSVRAEEKQLWLRSSTSSKCPKCVMADPVRLRQVLLNLLGNAIKFTEVGGVEIRVEAQQNHQGKDELRISVVDSGIGMSNDQLSKAFTAFTQADNSTSRKFGGTGLGLAISKRLMELMGGTILVESEVGLGSTFTIVLPITSTCSSGVEVAPQITTTESSAAPIQPPLVTESQMAESPATELEDSSESAARRRLSSTTSTVTTRLDGLRILLAEDGIDNQRLISHILRKNGAQVEIAPNGQIAAECLLSRPTEFDIVLMDMQMPVLDGYQATRKLRTEGYFGPIIALTAHAMAGDRAKCLEAGCDEYLTKPVDRSAIVETIYRLVTSPATKVTV